MAIAGLATNPLFAESWKPTVTRSPPQRVEVVSPTPADLRNWGARIKYGIANGSPDIAGHFAKGDERGWSKAVFATVHRRFPNGETTPYIGVGAGYAEGLVTAPSEVAPDALAFKGVVGTEMTLEEGLGAFVEYSFAVSPDANTGPGGSLRSHAWTTGIKLDLN